MKIIKTKHGDWAKIEYEGDIIRGDIIAININNEEEHKSHIIIQGVEVCSNHDHAMINTEKPLFFNILPWMVEGFHLSVGKSYEITYAGQNGAYAKYNIAPYTQVHEDWLVHDTAEAQYSTVSEQPIDPYLQLSEDMKEIVDFFTQLYNEKMDEANQYKKILEILGGV